MDSLVQPTPGSATAPAPSIELAGVTKRFTTPGGTIYTALQDLSLTVSPGEFCAVVGPTGCGKSTTLTLVSGLERPSSGTVTVDGEPVSGIPSGVGFMFQTDAILPWKSVLDNVALGPRFRGTAKGQAHDMRGTGSAESGSPGSRTGSLTSSRAGCASASRWRRA